MKNSVMLFTVIAILFSAGCEQSQKAPQNSVASDKREKLMAAENISLKAEMEKTRSEMEKLNKTISKLKKDSEAIEAENSSLYTLRAKYDKSVQELADIKKQLALSQDMLESKDAPALCKAKIEQQKKLLAECKKERDQIQSSSDDATKFLMDKIPGDLMQQVQTLTAENEQLKSKIAELEKQLQDSNSTTQN